MKNQKSQLFKVYPTKKSLKNYWRTLELKVLMIITHLQEKIYQT